VTVVILLNVLISLFASAYSEIVADAEAQFLAFFAGKTIGMIRAPDSYVYPAPFNLIEMILVAPFESFPIIHFSNENYARLNRCVMATIFIIPLSIIALVEASQEAGKRAWIEHWFMGDDDMELDSPEIRNPEVNDQACRDKQISKVPFEELIKVFPNTQQSIEASVLNEVDYVKEQLAVVIQQLNALGAK